MRLRQHIAVYLFYFVVTLAITYPLITVIGTRMIGHPFGDAYEYTHHIWWIKMALQTGQNPFFMPNLLYPDGLSATLLRSLPLQSFPAWLFAFVMTLPAAFNISALLTLALNGWAMFVLVNYLVKYPLTPKSPLPHKAGVPTSWGEGTLAPALVAGLVFMIYPAFQGQLGAAHVGLLTLWPAPLYFCALLHLRDTAHLKRTILAGAILFMVSLWGSVLLLIYLIAPITAVFFAMRIAARDWRTVRRALVMVVLGGIFALPFVVPLAIETLHAPPEAGAVRYSASLLGVVSPSFYHPLFTGWDTSRRVLGVDPFEQASYVGVIAGVLGLVAVWKRREARWWLGMALVTWVFSLGPLLKIYDVPLVIRLDGYATHISLPWALFQNLPLISIARTAARFNFAVGFAMAVLVGYGVSVILPEGRKLALREADTLGLSRRKKAAREAANVLRNRRWLFVVVLMVGIGFEYQFWWPLLTIPGIVPAPIAALAGRSDIRAVLDIPWYHPLVNKGGMFLQTGDDQPMIIGQISRSSPINPAKVKLLQDTLDAALLDAAGVDVVILHVEYDGSDGAVGAFTRQKLGVPFYEDGQYAVFNVPNYHGDAPGFVTDNEGANLYFYAPQAGQATLTGSVAAENRGAMALLDGATLVRWTVRDPQHLRVPIPFAAGYHMITISNDPVCPVADDSVLMCPALTVKGLSLEDYQSTHGGS